MIEVEPQHLYYLNPGTDVCLVSGEKQYTRRQLLAETGRISARYTAAPGARIAILAENRPEWAAAFLSAWKVKAVAVPIDAMSAPEDVAYILKDSGASVLFCTEKTRETAAKAVSIAETSPKVIDLDLEPGTWEDAENPEPMPKHEPDDLAVLVYTSGTTSAAKGCMVSFHNLEINHKSMTEEVPVWLPDQVTIALLPFHHILPLQGCLLMPLHRKGCRIVFIPNLTGPEILKAIHDNQATVFIAVPRVFQMFRDSILKKIRENPIAWLLFKFSRAVGSIRLGRFLFHKVQETFGGHIRYFPTGGAALDYSIYYDLCALGFEMLPGCGMSETAPVVAFTRPGHPRKDSAGQLMDIIEGKISDEGEILLRGDGIIKGYWNKPEETAKAFDSEGWLHTGDLGRIDDEKYIFYTGRKKELIILSNGKNVPPLVIEEKIMKMTDLIAEMAVTNSGDILHALILPDFKVTEAKKIVNISETIRQEVIAKYNQQAEPYMRILKCTFISVPLPRTRLGKLQRHKLRELAVLSTDRIQKPVIPDPDTEEYRAIKEFLTEDLRCENVSPDDHFEIDLGVDSMSKIELLVSLNEAFGADLKEEDFADHSTPRKLAEVLHENRSRKAAKQIKADWKSIFQEQRNIQLPVCSFTHVPLNVLSKGLQKLLFRIKRSGEENIPHGPCIFVCNHQSFMDGLFVMGSFGGKVMKETCFYASQRHVKGAFARSTAARHNVIVVDMNSDIKGSLCKLAEVLKQGKKVAIFPEGTRTHDGTLGHFKSAFAILAEALRVPVIPVVIQGAYDVLPRGKHFPRFFRKISVTILPAYTPEERLTVKEITEKTEELFRKELEKNNL